MDNFYFYSRRKKLSATNRRRSEADKGNDNGAYESNEQNFVNFKIWLPDNNISGSDPDNNERERRPRIFHKFNLTQKFANFFILFGITNHEVRKSFFGHQQTFIFFLFQLQKLLKAQTRQGVKSETRWLSGQFLFD